MSSEVSGPCWRELARPFPTPHSQQGLVSRCFLEALALLPRLVQGRGQNEGSVAIAESVATGRLHWSAWGGKAPLRMPMLGRHPCCLLLSLLFQEEEEEALSAPGAGLPSLDAQPVARGMGTWW